jgi:hypothetical protein
MPKILYIFQQVWFIEIFALIWRHAALNLVHIYNYFFQIDGTVKSIHAETPGEGLCKGIEETGATLAIVGTRGMGTLRRTFLGSVSDYVLHHAHVPVLICRHESDHDQSKGKKH